MTDPKISNVEYQFISQIELEDEISNSKSINNQQDGENLILKFLEKLQKNPIFVQDDFKDLKWINVTESLSLKKNFDGLITVCDFFTYCCINCLHILPFLHRIEKKYNDKEVIFLGIHSPKFENEKSLNNVMNAIIRHGITHPVCNDIELKLWNQLCIHCWPTIVIISPNGQLLFTLMGEQAIQEKLEFYLDICLKHFDQNKQLFLEKKLSIPINIVSIEQKQLNYPTKIAVSNDEKRLAISNTLSNTIIVANVDDGIVELTIGSSNVPGFQDGLFEKALFNYPQGIAWIDSNTFFVCDTENNAIRKINLISKTVETVAKSLNSPWDLTYNPNDNRLYIAVAGAHQIWTLLLSNKQDEIINDDHKQYLSCTCFAGDGREQKRNHRNLLKSSFAQPTGIALSSSTNIIYVADSESSSIRTIDLNSNSVSTIVGGSVDPTDLFSFGDIDDIGSKCRLQHCMGICCGTDDNIYIADTFNHKIKKIETKTKKCENLTIYWNDDIDIDDKFNEPNGLCFLRLRNVLLIADTNNHRIVSIDLNEDENKAKNFSIINPPFCNIDDESLNDDDELNSNINLDSNFKTIIIKTPLKISCNQKKSKFFLCFKFTNDDFKANTEAKHKIKFSTKTLSIKLPENEIRTNNLNKIEFLLESTAMKNEFIEKAELLIECNLNLCHLKNNSCTILKLLIKQPIIVQTIIENIDDDDEKIIEINL